MDHEYLEPALLIWEGDLDLPVKPARPPKSRITSIAPPASRGERARGYLIDPRLNDSYRVINMLLAVGVRVWRFRVGVEAGGLSTPPGGFYVGHMEEGLER